MLGALVGVWVACALFTVLESSFELDGDGVALCEGWFDAASLL